jgi:hypothetical protein
MKTNWEVRSNTALFLGDLISLIWNYYIIVNMTYLQMNLIWPSDGYRLFFFFLWYWGSNSGPSPWATPPALFCEGFYSDRVSRIICLGLALNHDSPDLCFLSSEPLAPGLFFWVRADRISQTGLKLVILLPQSHEYWDCRHVLPSDFLKSISSLLVKRFCFVFFGNVQLILNVRYKLSIQNSLSFIFYLPLIILFC